MVKWSMTNKTQRCSPAGGGGGGGPLEITKKRCGPTCCCGHELGDDFLLSQMISLLAPSDLRQLASMAVKPLAVADHGWSLVLRSMPSYSHISKPMLVASTSSSSGPQPLVNVTHWEHFNVPGIGPLAGDESSA